MSKDTLGGGARTSTRLPSPRNAEIVCRSLSADVSISTGCRPSPTNCCLPSPSAYWLNTDARMTASMVGVSEMNLSALPLNLIHDWAHDVGWLSLTYEIPSSGPQSL